MEVEEEYEGGWEDMVKQKRTKKKMMMLLHVCLCFL